MQMTTEWQAPSVLLGNVFPMVPPRAEKQNYEKRKVPCSSSPAP